MNVKSKVRKILGPLEGFSLLESLPAELSRKWLLDDDVLGVYRNSFSDFNSAIIISEQGMVVVKGSTVHRFSYDDVNHVEYPKTKEKPEDIIVHLVEGDVVYLPVRLGQGRFKDAFEFSRFLMRVLDLQKKGSEKL